MNVEQIVILALIQSATEFIPISSSGHLVLIRKALGWSDEGGLVLDTVLHAGSLLAILIYFWRDWIHMGESFVDPHGKNSSHYRLLPLWTVVATLPIILVGPWLAPRMDSFRTLMMVGLVMILSGIWFCLCEKASEHTHTKITFGSALFMGLAQIAALLPGASRSGLTTGAGLLCGIKREEAARFSFFMAIPAILGAILLKGSEIVDSAQNGLPATGLWIGFLVCFVVSMGAIHLCLRLYRRHSLIPFAVYLGLLGTCLIIKQLFSV